MAKKKLQMVWPKDGYKGSRPRGFFGGLRDIFSGTGPDMFVQEAGSRDAITPGQWGNWNSYHDPSLMAAPGPWKTRGFERYDPYSRKYTNWGPVARPWKDDNPYPRFTADEMRKMRPRILKGKDPKPSQMGSEWTHLGPKRFRPEHDYFWQHAHRIGENYLDGLPWDAPINPWLQMGQRRRDQLGGYAELHWP